MSDTVLENRMTTLEERLSLKVDRLIEDGKRRDCRIDRLIEDGKRRAREIDRLSEKLYRMDRRIDRLSENVYRMDRRIHRLSDMVYEISKNMDRSDENPERPSQKVEPVDSFKEEMRAEQKKWNIQLAESSSKRGRMVEDLLAPSLPDVLREIVPCPPDDEPLLNIHVRRRHPKQRQKIFEVDGVVDSGEYALFCECKSELESADITKLVAKLAQARDYFPQYANHHLLGAVATLHIEPSLVQYASDKGILAFAVGQELMDVQNEAGFTPKHF